MSSRRPRACEGSAFGVRSVSATPSTTTAVEIVTATAMQNPPADHVGRVVRVLGHQTDNDLDGDTSSAPLRPGTTASLLPEPARDGAGPHTGGLNHCRGPRRAFEVGVHSEPLIFSPVLAGGDPGQRLR